MTSRLEKMTATAGKTMSDDWERQQRASAPTLRDLLATPDAVLANVNTNQVPCVQTNSGSVTNSR